MRVNGHHLIERKKKTLIDGPESGDSTTIIEIVRVIDNRTYKVTEHVKNGFMIGNESVETCMTEAEVRQFESDWSKYQKQIEQANVKLDLEWENHMERLRMEKCRANMEKIPNEIWLKIFSYLEVQDLCRSARGSKQFCEIAYERGLWQKLPINLTEKQVPVEFVQHIIKRGIAYINLDCAEIVGASLHFAQQNSLKYLILDFQFEGQEEVMKNLLASCTQLEKLSCYNACYESEFDDIFQCIGKNSESLKCLEIRNNEQNHDDVMKWMAINKCNKLEELSLDDCGEDFIQYIPQDLKKLELRFFRIEELKLLVTRCSKLEDLHIDIYCCHNYTCHHFDEAISIIVGSPMSETLVSLSLLIDRINFHEEFSAKCLELGQMKKLKKIKIWWLEPYDEMTEAIEAKDMLRKNLPNLTHIPHIIMEDSMEVRKYENFPVPADPYAKHDKSTGFWEISCDRLL